ncbi:hypothetical protein B5C34_07385 [Pacificimonas flava]|uniref:Alkaline phosphatase n=2 Tax=Pacificimonas TaxID=1960290 RepID=A0A219B4K6_9SPHN|nr:MULTISPECIES: choice-of-anchor I family protein [Pacificimonas]MBZ6379517.1 choice-of-anchor I family protein [Pacificimonas aurantium]OWV33295.1 hypothetical protein B5C34_07385 [Pacificimonas flava]
MDFDISLVGTFDSGVGEAGSEVVSVDGDILAVTNGAAGRVDLFSQSSGELVLAVYLGAELPDDAPAGAVLLPVAGFDGLQSVAINNGIVAVAIARDSADGVVQTFSAADGSALGTYEVGNLPDQVSFSQDGTKIFVANEGERGDAPASEDGGAGTISIIDLTVDADAPGAVRNFGLQQFNDITGDGVFTAEDRAQYLAQGIRAAADSVPSLDFEPEYIVEGEDGRLYVSLQEANAIAVFDLETMAFVDLFSAGLKDYSVPGNGFDPSDEDGAITILNYDVIGFNMPDALASFTIGGETYILTANEGDSRDFDETRVEDLDLDPTAYPNAAELQAEAALGRLQAVNTEGDTDGDGDIDQIYAFGGRSFTILDSDGNVVFDSGDDFEQIIAAARVPNAFNNDDYVPGEGDPAEVDDNRSDAKGPEPEAIAVGEIDGQVYAFIGMERDSGIFVYDVTNPQLATFVDYIDARADGFISPEVIQFISAAESSTGQAQIAVSFEVSGNTAVYELGLDGFGLDIGQVQGTGQVSEYAGTRVGVRGIVTAVDSNGFYLQDADGDGNMATSDAIFVFTGGAPAVELGDELDVQGTVSEYTPGGSSTGNLSTTQLSSADITVLSSDNALPEAVLIGPSSGILPPTASVEEGVAFYEQFEGMRVTFESPVLVAPQSQFREFFAVLSDGEGNLYGTNFSDRGTINIVGGEGGLGFTNTIGGDFNPEIVQFQSDFFGVSDGISLPDVIAGARFGNVTGVLSYDFGVPELLVTDAPELISDGTIEPEVTTVAGDEDTLTVASFNVLNLDRVDADGNGEFDVDADSDVAEGRFDAVADIIVNNLGAPDIIALQEVNDDSGTLLDGVVTAEMTLEDIVAAIEAVGGPTYSYIDNPFITDEASGGVPGGNIRNVFLYRDDRVDLVEGSVTSIQFEDQATNEENPFYDARLPLVAEFEFGGESYTIVNNHFSSKGGSTPLLGVEQPPVNGSALERAAQADAVADYVESLGGDAQVVVLGDLNEFEFEEPLDPLYDAGLVNLTNRLPEEERYTYLFNGNSQALDHIFVSQNVAGGAEYDIVHASAEFNDRGAPLSDHDPVIVSIDTGVDYSLQLLHVGDPELGQFSETAENVAALIDIFEGQADNSITLFSGDNYIPGPFLTAGYLTTGDFVDIQIMNAMGVEASAIGNHEFDLGTGVFADAVSTAAFPYVSANLDFSGDSSLADLYFDTSATSGLDNAADLAGRIVPATVIEEGGERIGVVGATTQILESISSTGGVEVIGPNADDMSALAAILQPYIDEMTAAGVDKIILVSHLQQIQLEEALAPLLDGVDIIIAGGSNTLLADDNDELAAFTGHPAEADGPYPIMTNDASGNTTVIVNTDNEYTYLGRLVVDFDADGNIIADSIEENADIAGAYAATKETVADAYGVDIDELDDTAFADGTRGGEVRDLIQPVQDVIDDAGSNVFGYVSVYLEGARGEVRTQETNLGNLTADANAYAYRERAGEGDDTVVVSIKNGGGIRAAIGTFSSPGPNGEVDELPPAGGGVSELDIANSLRFNNTLVALDTDPAGLKAILENGVSGIAGATEGRFPQVAGVRFSFDQSQPVGERVEDIALVDGDGNIIPLYDDGVLIEGAPANITVVTLGFLAEGGDGYPFADVGTNFRAITEDGIEDVTFNQDGELDLPGDTLGEQQAFQDYLSEEYPTPEQAFDSEDTSIEDDTRIQNQEFREDTVLTGDPVGGSGAATLQLLHFGDPEFGLLAGDTAPLVAALLDAYADDYANTLILSSGDNYIPGPFRTASDINGTGFAEIQVLNAMGVQATAIGNHEFDLGTGLFADAVSASDFAHISANLDFSSDSSTSDLFVETVGTGGLETAEELAGQIAPSAVIEQDGATFGIVGATTQILETISSTGGIDVVGPDMDDMQALAAILQPVIDDLTAQGVDKIILLSHLQQIQLEQALAPLLEDVDIIVAGGSNTRLGDETDEAVAFPGHEAEFEGSYPIETQDANGNPLLIVNTDNEFTYLGRLVVDFDENGNVISDSLEENVELSGAYAATLENVAEAYGFDTVGARVSLNAGQSGGLGAGRFNIFGTASADETITVLDGAVLTLDASFNRGGDTISFAGESAEYSVDLTGSVLVIRGDDGTIVALPIGAEGATLEFADESFVARFDGANVLVGDQVVTSTETYIGGEEADRAIADDMFGLNGLAFEEGSRADEVRDIIAPVQEIIDEAGSNIFGFTDVYLEGARGAVRTEETNLGNLTADANLNALEDRIDLGDNFAVSIKNGGGIRAAIGTFSSPGPNGEVDQLPPPPNGGVSELDISNALRFNNQLVAVDVDAIGLKAILEHGVSGIAGATEGRFPQVGGVRFSFDQSQPVGDRVEDIALLTEDGTLVPLYSDGELVDGAGDLGITIVTLNFMAEGGDGYPFPDVGANFRALTEDGAVAISPDENDELPLPGNSLGEQQALQEYLAEEYPTEGEAFSMEETSIENDTRIQNEEFRESTVLEGEADSAAAAFAPLSADDDLIECFTGFDDLIPPMLVEETAALIL